jgi:hypothetical protein
VTRLPQLEQELVAAAGRLPRRAVVPVARAAVATAVVIAAITAGVVVSDGGGRSPAGGTAPAAFGTDATLPDMLAVFRRPATPADDPDLTPADIPDRRPGEDPARARRIDWPDATIFLWPWRDGVCQSFDPKRVQASGTGCPPLDVLRRTGVAVGLMTREASAFAAGVAVDGVDEVVLKPDGGRDVRLPVRDNTFVANLGPFAGEGARLEWTYAGEERSFDLTPILTELPAPTPHPDPVAGSISPPLEFTADGKRYSAIGFHTGRTAVCTRLSDRDTHSPLGYSCLNERLLGDALRRQPALLFAGGDTEQAGFARADVTKLTAGDAEVALSEPWRPEPWPGEPIRFFYVFAGARMPLTAALADGRTVEVP